MNLYSQLKGKIVTKEWVSKVFKFCKGIFTGDNYSPIIFNVIFQPLIDFIMNHKESQGYSQGNTKVITKPFADDFELISNHKTKHQKLQDQIQLKASSMWLPFNPSKYRSLSIKGGHPASDTLFLTDPSTGENVQLETLEADPHKFLGCVITHNNSAKDHLDFLKTKLTSKLENLDKTVVRPEYKVAVYSRYALPSLRYHLTVHTLHQCHMVDQRFPKKWLGIPTRGCQNAGGGRMFHPHPRKY